MAHKVLPYGPQPTNNYIKSKISSKKPKKILFRISKTQKLSQKKEKPFIEKYLEDTISFNKMIISDITNPNCFLKGNLNASSRILKVLLENNKNNELIPLENDNFNDICLKNGYSSFNFFKSFSNFQKMALEQYNSFYDIYEKTNIMNEDSCASDLFR